MFLRFIYFDLPRGGVSGDLNGFLAVVATGGEVVRLVPELGSAGHDHRAAGRAGDNG
jgi:hypothetical protein